MGSVIVGLFIWATVANINQPPSIFYVTPLTLGLALASIFIALVSYFNRNETFQQSSVFAAYILLFGSISILVLQTGTENSPFLALWLIATIFVGAFGNRVLLTLLIGITAYIVYILIDGGYTEKSFVSMILVGVLPILISYVLWHEKSRTENGKDRAYHELANELNQVSNKSDVVISAISDGVLAVNNQGVIELINPAAQRIVGWGHQDALNLDYKSVLQLLSKDGHEVDKSTDPIFSVLTTNQPVRRNDLQVQTNSGKKVTIEIVVSPIGRIGSGAIIVFRDITKQLAEEAAQTEFISTASHEMRTPVASIEGYLGLALNPATATIDDKARDFITKAHESARHLGHLFQDLLDVTKADDGRLSNNPKVINVVEFTDSIIEGLRPKADEKQLRLFFKPETSTSDGGLRNIAPVFFVDLDADHLREIIANLVENAIKYTPHGEVVIDVTGDNSHVIVSITDSGIGIPMEDIPHLFQKFYRVDNSDTREIGGTGLGLYLCRRLIEAMGGRIWVDSEYKKGSTFSIELPRISHEEASRLIEASTTTASTATTVKTSNPDGDDDDSDAMTAQQRDLALSTPLILNTRGSVNTPNPIAPMATADPSTAAPVDVAVSDPLVGTPVANAENPPQMTRPQNPMVLPPSLQSIPSTLQTAQQPPVQKPQPVTAAAPDTTTVRPLAVPNR